MAQRHFGARRPNVGEGYVGWRSFAAHASYATLQAAPEKWPVAALKLLHYSNSAMAEKLFISDSTVRTHLRQINRKLGAASRTQAVAIARKCGLVG